ncbi:MAG: FtsQ-type POTRA domain-containing protein [bacterium]|nr:FtsQ-type POTRA domain-containing protein [bacterium]
MQDYSPRKSKATPSHKRRKSRLPTSGAPLLGMLRGLLTLAGLGLILVPFAWAPIYLQGSLRKLAVQGNQVLSGQAVAARLQLAEGTSWLGLDLYSLAERLLADPWIEQVDLKKTGSLGLLVQVKERQPVAYLQTEAELYLIDQNLMILGRPAQWGGWDLPVLSDSHSKSLPIGTKLQSAGVNKALELMALLENDPVLPLASVSEFLVDDPTNIRLITQPGALEFRFGHDGFEEKIKRLHLASAELHRREDRLMYVDLRNPHGVVIKRK